MGDSRFGACVAVASALIRVPHRPGLARAAPRSQGDRRHRGGWRGGRGAARRAGAPLRGAARPVALGHVRRQPHGGVPAGLLRHAPAGAPAAVGLPPAAAGHRVLRRVHDVLDDAARAAADARRPPLRPGRRLHRGVAGARLRRRASRHRDGAPRKDGRVSALTWVGVAVLGGAGAIGRFLFDWLVSSRAGRELPLGTFAVNISGALILGLLTGLALTGDALVLAGTATIGAYTTFSTWMFETQRLVEEGELAGAAANALVSVAAGIAAIALGRLIGAHL